jgi:RimJ/RimL family protein N-acetyltransferase
MLTKKHKLNNGKVLIIREAQKKDAVSILEYVERIASETNFLTFGPGEFNLSLEQEEQLIESHLNTDNKLLIIAEINQELVGCLNFTGGNRPRIQHTGELGRSVLKEYWGLGIGSALVQTVIQWAKSTGIINKINLRVRPDNDRAIRLYERFGFVREGLITREYSVNERFYHNVVMGVQID